MSRYISEDDVEKEGILVCKKDFNFKNNVFELKVYAFSARYIGRVYLDGRRYNPQDYVQGKADAEKQLNDGFDICERFFKDMEGDLKSNQNPHLPKKGCTALASSSLQGSMGAREEELKSQ